MPMRSYLSLCYRTEEVLLPAALESAPQPLQDDTFSISALHLAIKVLYFSNSGHKNEKVTTLTDISVQRCTSSSAACAKPSEGLASTLAHAAEVRPLGLLPNGLTAAAGARPVGSIAPPPPPEASADYIASLCRQRRTQEDNIRSDLPCTPAWLRVCLIRV
eukprot:SAG31_NODE_8550_length_1431_cov_2.201201_1_plen_161_part_00